MRLGWYHRIIRFDPSRVIISATCDDCGEYFDVVYTMGTCIAKQCDDGRHIHCPACGAEIPMRVMEPEEGEDWEWE